MSEGHLQMKLVYELGVLLVGLLGYQLLEAVIRLVSGRLLELYRSRSIGLHSQYIRSFSIIGALWFLLLAQGY